MMPYRPEPFTDFRDPREEAALQAAIAQVTAQLGGTCPLLIGGKPIGTERHIVSINPSQTEQVIGRAAKADLAQAESAVQAAHEAFRTWSRTGVETRAELLFKAAAMLRRRKHEFSAWLMLEAGKSRGEADAETAEAIDFMEYYGRQMLALAERGGRELIPLQGERNRLEYIPLGVGVVIPPWNFPLAILAGMTTAALVAGNTVVLKPSSATPVIAWRFVQLLLEAGLPDGVLSFVSGSGAEIGDYLVQHKLTRFVSFTGSREVGVRMNELAAQTAPGQKWLKRFIGELGGKDAIVVDADADLEQAAQAIVVSAFGYSGQKCSACSRAIVHRDVYDEVLERCIALTEALKVGDVRDAANYTGPVIDRSAYAKILEYIGIAQREGRIVTGGEPAEAAFDGGSGSAADATASASAASGRSGDVRGYFIRPTIVEGVRPEARIMREEIFGPVLAFARADDFRQALDIANDTDYGLTGSVFTRSRAHIDLAKADFHAGNLYVNRKCTGAIVGVHPFGGFNMSGTDSKAGGPDYLLLFTQPKLTSELL
ncbi:L-glutamate gamma-semialdehyde dehydrogenase [Paenibacillus hamazuiensis]|uniref:L-glutamate gamma-semialdehyde dehydrogenase n=1 Tax=Paenibacillus hamazuiensis TaxID=2936508 RepID=UPI00200E4C87|nr:L-glutamate gamma-semialdehyde dehydrogenase [Paenibacillus hamazuiensis]